MCIRDSLWILIEDVVNHLHRINLASLNSSDAIPGLPTIETDTNRLNQTLAAKVVEFVEPPIVSQPFIVPGVKLHEIETLQSRVFQTAMSKLFDMIRRVRCHQRRLRFRRPLFVFGRNLRRGVQPLVRVSANNLAEKFFAVAVAVSICGIEKINTQINCCLKS